MNNLTPIAEPPRLSSAQLNDHRRGRGAFYSLLILLLISPFAMSFWFGIEFAVVSSSSMEPAISAGDLEITKPASAIDIKIGDVILLAESKTSSVYSHRVTKVNHQLTGVLIQTRGDANQFEDTKIAMIPNESKISKSIFIIPKLGYLVTWLVSAPSRFILGFVIAISSIFLIFQSIQNKSRLGK